MNCAETLPAEKPEPLTLRFRLNVWRSGSSGQRFSGPLTASKRLETAPTAALLETGPTRKVDSGPLRHDDCLESCWAMHPLSCEVRRPAWEVDRWTRKIAGSGRGADGQAPLPLAETTSEKPSPSTDSTQTPLASCLGTHELPRAGQALQHCFFHPSCTRGITTGSANQIDSVPRFRASVKRPAISASSKTIVETVSRTTLRPHLQLHRDRQLQWRVTHLPRDLSRFFVTWGT